MRDAVTGTAKARPRSLGSNIMASMALPLAVTMAAPNPPQPLQMISWVRFWDVAATTFAMVITIRPVKNTWMCPYFSPSRAARKTVLPSTSSRIITDHAASSTPTLK